MKRAIFTNARAFLAIPAFASRGKGKNTTFGWTRSSTLLGLAILLSPAILGAAQHRPKQDAIELMGTVQLQGRTVHQIKLGTNRGRNLLYLEDSSQHSLLVVDVTDPSHPAIAREITLPQESGTVEVVAGEAALLANGSSAVVTDVQSLSIVSVSSTQDDTPRVTRTFPNVTAWAPDDRRGLIYPWTSTG
jgi:hypothetical protein